MECHDDPNRRECQSKRSANVMLECTVRARGNFSDVHSEGSLLICVSEKSEGKDVRLTYGDKGGRKENHGKERNLFHLRI